ncbi:MAG: DUF882 domain-containing protein [Hydrogenimonas sp.]|nr:DUF882 domain-containing protein [Hydrogenimonas sp.]
MKRREFLKKAAAICAITTFPNIILAKSASKQDRREISLFNLHTHESVKATYWADGRYFKEEIEELNRVLRDFRTGEVHPIDLALFDLLCDLGNSLGVDSPFHVISGYRSPKTNETLRRISKGVAKRSLHMQGRAIDINLPGLKLETLRLAAAKLRRGGVGFYPKSGFIHIDTGRVRYW